MVRFDPRPNRWFRTMQNVEEQHGTRVGKKMGVIVSFWRRWTGDESFALVKVPDAWSQSEALELVSVFSEAVVYWHGDYISPIAVAR